MQRIYVLVYIALLAPTLAMAGKVYKWVDEDGNVHFGDQPQTGSQAESVTILKHTPDQQYRSRMQDIKENQAIRRDEARERKAEQQKVAQADAARCQQAKSRLRLLQQQVRIFSYDAAGEPVYMEDDQRATQIKELKKITKQTCK